MTRQVWQTPSPTAWAAVPTISLMVGTPVGQAHLRDEPLRVDQSEPPLRIIGRGEVGPWRPLRRRAAAAAGNWLSQQTTPSI
jgi:hypothetical protein